MKLCPEFAGRGRYFDFKSNFIPASIDYAEDSPLCTTLSKDGFKIRTVEHLLSAMEAMGVDNCRIEITNEDAKDSEVEVRVTRAVSSFYHRICENLACPILIDFPECRKHDNLFSSIIIWLYIFVRTYVTNI